MQLVGAAAVVLSLTVAGVALRAHEAAKLDSARDAARTARLALEQVAARAAHSDSVAASAELRAQAAIAREQQASAHADSASKSLSVLRERYRVASAVVPDTCRAIKAAADSALAVADSVATAERAARAAADDRATLLQVGFDTTRDALAQLRASALQSATATAHLEAAGKPPLLSRLFSRITPRLGIGIAAGLDLHRRPNLVTGITLSIGNF